MFFQKRLYLAEMPYSFGLTPTPRGVGLCSPLPPPVTFQGVSKETGCSRAYEIHFCIYWLLIKALKGHW